MSTSLSLPPTARDFLVYQRVVIEAVSTCQAAAEFSLSQTRIRQLVQRVSRWLTENLPPQDEATDAAYLRHAQHVAADRLSFFYGEAMEGWRAERQMKYMNLAIRVALAQSKLAVLPGTIDCLAADAIEGPLPENEAWARPTENQTERQSDGETERLASADHSHSPCPPPTLPPSRPLSVSPSASAPPPRDCSPSSHNSHAAAASPPAPTTINPTPLIASNDLPPTTAAARRAFLAPAHPALPIGNLPVTELKITPHDLGLAETPTRSVSEGSLRSVSEEPLPSRSARRLSRRERRKLKRKLGA
jgi:hypothetical protein